MNKRITVCIPTYEMSGMGKNFLLQGFESLYKQSYRDFDIVVSDQSTDNDVKKVCQKWGSKMDISYFKFLGERGSSANTNNAIKRSTGEIIKILFMDDFFFDNGALGTMVEMFDKEPNKNWLVTACGHLYETSGHIGNFMVPSYHKDIHLGKNTISSPSVLSIRNINPLYFDEKLSWLMDVEYYKRLYDSFGLPMILDIPCIVNRIHSNSITTSLSSECGIKERELNYIMNKFSKEHLK